MNQSEIDQSVVTLVQHKDEWATLPIGRKLSHLEEMRGKTGKVAERWVDAAAKAKRIPGESPLSGEEWMSGPWALLRGLNQLTRTLSALEKGQPPPLARDAVHTRPDGQVIVDVFPSSIFDRLLLNGFSAEVWMQPGVTAEQLTGQMASFYRESSPRGKVVLVLGAGNIASIAPLDVLYKMFGEGRVCLLKMNPVNDYLGPFFEEIFGSLIDAGFVRFAYGGADVGAYLVAHEGIDEVHVTGDYRTYNAIVYGTGEEGETRRQRDEPAVTKPVTAELGNVSPTIVVPGPWSPADIAYQAEHVLTQKTHNAGFNCVATQVLVLPEEWDKTDDFVAAIRGMMKRSRPREPYYPGAAQRQGAVVAEHPEAELFEPVPGGAIPRVLITGLDATNSEEYCFTHEFFSDVLSVTKLPGSTAAEFLAAAVHFCNENLWGTLGANIIVHPQTMKELGPALESAIAGLRYGCIGVNAWIGVGFLLSETTWGAYPGHERDDIKSGTGVAHNSLLFDKPQKTVVRQPFFPFPRNLLHGEMHMSPKPAWFVTNKQSHNLGRLITGFEARPRFRDLPGIFVAALRG
jgi:aldehyde dehydrogenase (NAD(P)+)